MITPFFRLVSFIIFLGTSLLFGGESEPKITFLDPTEAKKAILDDISEAYFNTLQPLEMSAKTGSPISGKTLVEQQEECRRRYQQSVLEFSDDEKRVLRWYVSKLYPVLAENYPTLANVPWNFVRISDTLEGGLPHTRGSYILLSGKTLKQLILAHKMAPEAIALLQFGSLLVHEQIHILQRTKRPLFEKFYTEVWGFQKASKIQTNPWLEQRHLSNPDGVDCHWIFPIKIENTNRWIWPLIILDSTSAVPQMPQEFKMIGIELQKEGDGFRVKQNSEGTPVFSDLSSIFEYTRIFPKKTSIYHPNEASADLLAMIITFDAFAPKDQIPEAAFQQFNEEFGALRQWFRAHLK